jgi:glycosyltransferase involved in cell wall biosynthesis
MKIALFEDFFHPKAGYNINILSKYLSRAGHEIFIFTSEINKSPKRLINFFDVSNIEEKDFEFSHRHNVTIIRLKTLFFYSGRSIIRLKYLETIKKFSPDLLFISGNDTYVGILLTLLYPKLGIPLLFNSSMVEMASENRFSKIFRLFYKKFITPLIIKHNILTIRTQDDPYVMKFLGIPSELAPFIPYGIDLELFKPTDNNNAIREELGIPNNAFVIIYAGKLDESKGFSILFESLMFPFKDRRNLYFLIIGDSDKIISAKLNDLTISSSNNIIHFPTQHYERLSNFYAMSDLAIFPKQISLSFFNAQGCGLPVIAEKNNVNIDRLSHGNGLVFESGNAYDLIQKMKYIIDLDDKEYSRLSENAIKYVVENFDYNKLVLLYVDVFEMVIKNYRN